MLVVAGAGTGKTTVLTRRLCRLIREGHARPEEILAATYTENAAKEMQERVRAEVGSSLPGPRVLTFHAYCNNLLGDCGKDFRVLDDKDLWIFLRKRIRELELHHFVIPANVGKFLEDLLDFMRRCHDELVEPVQYAGYVARVERGELPVPRVLRSKHAEALSDDEVIARCREIAQVFTKVEAMLEQDNLGTFGHMITYAYQALQADPDLLARERARTRFVLADEFQDANFAQIKILQMLAGSERNVFAVGDPDQAIYRFRGASSAAFQLFQHSFPGAKLVALEKNRRSTTPILKTAYAIISKNPDALDAEGELHYRRTPLISARDEQAMQPGTVVERAPVDVVVLTGKDAEAAEVVRDILDTKRRSRCKWSDLAVLYRTHFHRDGLVEELAQRGVPFSIENMDVLDTSEAHDLLACAGAVVSEADDASLFRVAALSQFAIDPEKLRSGIRALPREQEGGGVATVLTNIENGSKVLNQLREVRGQITQQDAKGRETLEIIVRSLGFDRSSPPIAAVLDFVGLWEKKPITSSGELGELLEYLELFREAGGAVPMASPETEAVQLMTAHAAKGLEFKHVFVLRANSNSFPASYKESLVEFPRELRDPESLSPQDDKTLNDQEERRLFYVAMTRAEDSLTIYAKQGTGKKDPSPPGLLRPLLSDPAAGRNWRQRPASGFQTDLFARAASPALTCTAQWLSMPPAVDLSARLSASAVQTYETCPLQFKLEREWRIPGEAPAAMQYGGAMHRVLRAYYDSVRFGRPMSEEELIAQFRSDLTEAKIQDRYQYDLYERQGIDQLKGFLAACARAPQPEVLHTEQFFEVKIGRSSVVGRIDRVDKLDDGQVVITDYKTGKPQSQEDADQSLQLSIYALAAQEKWGYQVNHLALYNLAENTSVASRRSGIQLEDAKLKVEKVAGQVAEGRFEPKTGFHCRFCAYRSLCPATEKRFSPRGSKKNKNNRN